MIERRRCGCLIPDDSAPIPCAHHRGRPSWMWRDDRPEMTPAERDDAQLEILRAWLVRKGVLMNVPRE